MNKISLRVTLAAVAKFKASHSIAEAAYEEAVISLQGSSIRFLERDKSPIQRRASKILSQSTLGKQTVGTASTVTVR